MVAKEKGKAVAKKAIHLRSESVPAFTILDMYIFYYQDWIASDSTHLTFIAS